MKKVIFLAFVNIFLLSSCSKQMFCNNEPYAPEGAEVSWTDYNSVPDLIKYFQGHDSTLSRHEGDTIKMYGYFRYVHSKGGLPYFMASPSYNSRTAIRMEFPYGGPIHLDTINLVYLEATISKGRTAANNCYKYLFLITPLMNYFQ